MAEEIMECLQGRPKKRMGKNPLASMLPDNRRKKEKNIINMKFGCTKVHPYFLENMCITVLDTSIKPVHSLIQSA